MPIDTSAAHQKRRNRKKTRKKKSRHYKDRKERRKSRLKSTSIAHERHEKELDLNRGIFFDWAYYDSDESSDGRHEEFVYSLRRERRRKGALHAIFPQEAWDLLVKTILEYLPNLLNIPPFQSDVGISCYAGDGGSYRRHSDVHVRWGRNCIPDKNAFQIQLNGCEESAAPLSEDCYEQYCGEHKLPSDICSVYRNSANQLAVRIDFEEVWIYIDDPSLGRCIFCTKEREVILILCRYHKEKELIPAETTIYRTELSSFISKVLPHLQHALAFDFILIPFHDLKNVKHPFYPRPMKSFQLLRVFQECAKISCPGQRFNSRYWRRTSIEGKDNHYFLPAGENCDINDGDYNIRVM